jgi:RNA polymerase sigma factor (sigma-70 family)
MDGFELRTELEKYHRECFAWALSCCGRDPAQAEDVLQTVYLKVLENRARFDGRSAFKTWLLALIRNTAADEWRRKQRRECGPDPLGLDAQQEPPPDEWTYHLEVRELMTAALCALPPRQQEVLRLVFYHDLSVAGAAEVIGVSVGTARIHYERGKTGLRDWLEQRKLFDERRSKNQGTLC